MGTGAGVTFTLENCGFFCKPLDSSTLVGVRLRDAIVGSTLATESAHGRYVIGDEYLRITRAFAHLGAEAFSAYTIADAIKRGKSGALPYVSFYECPPPRLVKWRGYSRGPIRPALTYLGLEGVGFIDGTDIEVKVYVDVRVKVAALSRIAREFEEAHT